MVFFRYGNWTFGGGSATVSVLREELMDRKGWVSREAFTLAFGLARLTPGTNMLSFGTGIGWLLRGFSGALAVLFAASVPCSLLAWLATAFYETWSRNRFVIVGLKGSMAAAVGIMFVTGWTLILPYWKSVPHLRLLLFVLGGVALGVFAISPIWVLCAAAAIGFLWPEKTQA